jgi:hypothetical protein
MKGDAVKKDYTQKGGAVMKRVLPLCLAMMLAACDQAPPAAPGEPPQVKATPVVDAPKTSPMPIQPLSSAPAVPVTQPLPALVKPPTETGTAHGSPAVSSTAAQTGTAAASATPAASPSPSVSGS